VNPIAMAILAAGAIVNASLYFVLVFLAALHANNMPALYFDMTAVGITYLSFIAQLAQLDRMYTVLLVLMSVLTGGFAGVLLLVL